MEAAEGGKIFREAWIEGVQNYFQGEPRTSDIAPWEELQEWEQVSAASVFAAIREFVLASGGGTAKLSRAQRGRFVALCWIAQVHRHFAAPRPSYLADWDELPAWQQQTDADIFDLIEQEVLASA
ncbi:hypothetical protein EV385_6454 [Krasilnikovia cinnamomea]|uniref:Uncharacterized protein n=1 Tax=Krasilnikovia cinnamomea TaxID=349313 RepID=A0A4Q7ZV26_9ACTN|nr:hypothetical protein [Krasilnikovia cinnamomea]RZU54503.1 hypothetical protein EV385_6454 [Krasilnikovia cinnamomea]